MSGPREDPLDPVSMELYRSPYCLLNSAEKVIVRRVAGPTLCAASDESADLPETRNE